MKKVLTRYEGVHICLIT